MASVYKRVYESGTVVFRVILRKKGLKSFSLTFDDWDVACKWVIENEEEYYKDPQDYANWLKEEYRLMRQMKVRVRNNILRAKKVL